MFQLREATAKVVKFNPTSEKHGPEIVPGGSITLEVVASSEVLNDFQPGLREALYRAPTSGDQGSLLQAKNKDDLTAVRFSQLETSWSGEYPGYEAQISNGLGLEDPIVLVDAKLKNIGFKLLDGGSVGIKFTLIAHPDTDESGLLCHMQRREVQVTITPPARQAADEDLSEGSDTLDAQDSAAAAAEAASLIDAGKKAAA
ncbi:hypothetical protein XarjCFBP7645_09235 [Xanthomonas arboricola]|uniref:Uncharacterized protein n=1 Tax=Xanthomonas arboricola TaxID=56448 RepID=A0A2S7ADF9_9XANT|nr:hypothetical protein XarjCFBP7645_09235 [Xanthomonas arboricola]